jgi:hypothetical protein
MNMLKQASIEELLKAERIAIKYSPVFALMISKEIYNRKG